MTATRVSQLIGAIDLPPMQPIAFAARGRSGRLSSVAGRWAIGAPVHSDDLFYAASLTKQVTGTAMAQLVQEGVIDPDLPIPQSFLPKWPSLPTARQVLHHVASLPRAGPHEVGGGVGPWTNEYVMRLAADLNPPLQPIGTTFAYSNMGYVMLARLMERAAGTGFSQIAARVLPPSSASTMTFVDSDTLPTSAHSASMRPRLPLTTGDGGLWTTADAYADFLDMQNEDRSGTAALTQVDFTLSTGKSVGYGWGIGIREFRGNSLYFHGGSWIGACCKAVRCPALGMSAVVLTAGEQDVAVAKLLDELVAAVA